MSVFAYADTQDPRKAIFRQPPPTGGVNNRYDPRDIGMYQLAEGYNMDLFNPTRPTTRNGAKRLLWGTKGIPAQAMKMCRGGLAELNTHAHGRLLVGAYSGADGGLYYQVTPDDDTAEKALVTKGPPGAALPGQYAPGPDVWMFQGNDLLWICSPGANVHVLSPDGTLTDCGSGATSPPHGAVAGAYILERAWLLKGDRAYYSKLLPEDGDLYPTGAAFDETDYLTLSPERSADPRAIVAWRDGSLIVFFADHIEQITVDSGNPKVGSVRKIVNTRLGTISARTVISVGDEVFFLDQYSEMRSLRRTTFGTLEASRPLPLTEPIEEEFPGRCRPVNWKDTWMQWHRDRIYVHYTRDGASGPNASVNLIMPKPYGLPVESGLPKGWRWECPWVYGFTLAYGISSSIRSGAEYEYLAGDASDDASHRLYHLNRPFSRLDDAEPFESWLTGRMHTRPGEGQSRYVMNRYAIAFDGDYGAKVTLAVRSRNWDEFTDVARKGVETSVETDFPLVFDSSFPLVIDDDFPLVFARPKETRDRGTIDEAVDQVSKVISGVSSMPAGGPQLPAYGPGRLPAGHGVQWRLSCDTPGRRWKCVDVALEAAVTPAGADLGEEI